MPTGEPRCRCPACGQVLTKRRQGAWTLKTPMLVWGDAGLQVVCFNCKAHVDVPWLQVTESTAPRRRRVLLPLRRVDEG